MSRWQTLDVAAMLKQEVVGGATTSANAGAFAVPLGAHPVSRYPVGAQDHHVKRRRESEDAYGGGGYQSYDDWMMPSRV